MSTPDACGGQYQVTGSNTQRDMHACLRMKSEAEKQLCRLSMGYARSQTGAADLRLGIETKGDTGTSLVALWPGRALWGILSGAIAAHCWP